MICIIILLSALCLLQGTAVHAASLGGVAPFRTSTPTPKPSTPVVIPASRLQPTLPCIQKPSVQNCNHRDPVAQMWDIRKSAWNSVKKPQVG
jgi:hypothetical protein